MRDDDWDRAFEAQAGCSANLWDVVEKVHQYEGVEPEQQSRRWWTDSAPEFSAASRVIRSLRPLAHFRAIPHLHESNGIIERRNRTITEGTNAILFVAGADSQWWVLAAPYWCAMYNASAVDAAGLTPWYKRYGEDAPYKMYPWGALVLVKPLDEAKQKFLPKMTPHILVGIGTGPGCVWDHTYLVIKLSKMLGDKRPSRVHVKRTAAIEFPEKPSFPLKMKLDAAGALGDAALPGPAVVDEADKWDLCTLGDDASEDEDDNDGSLGENEPKLGVKLAEPVTLGSEAEDDDDGIAEPEPQARGADVLLEEDRVQKALVPLVDRPAHPRTRAH